MLWFWINDSLSSSITGVFLSFQVLKHPDKKFRVGQALRATVVGPDSSKAFLCLSLIGVGMKQCLVGERKWREGVGWVFNFCSSWRTPSVLASLESLVWDSSSLGLCSGPVTSLLSELPLPTQVFFSSPWERVVHHLALGFLAAWQGDLSLDGSGSFSLDTPSLGSLHHPQPVCGQHSRSSLSSFPLPWIRLVLPPGPHKLEEGEVAMGRVVKVTPNEGLTVSFPFGKIGTVSIFHVSDSYSEMPLEDFVPQKVVR